ncbi:hypothetical protein HQ529_04895 [Candidatus Woesearchaeota archaeon]|nr:hypothetical protein [Candidatus Woesearchaeota archaeon]
MKERITVTIDKQFLKWIDDKIDKKIFANRSHCFEFLVNNKILEEKNEQKKG